MLRYLSLLVSQIFRKWHPTWYSACQCNKHQWNRKDLFMNPIFFLNRQKNRSTFSRSILTLWRPTFQKLDLLKKFPEVKNWIPLFIHLSKWRPKWFVNLSIKSPEIPFINRKATSSECLNFRELTFHKILNEILKKTL